MRLSRTIAILSALLSAAPAAAQPHIPVTVAGVFQPDQPEPDPAHVQVLKDALKEGQLTCSGDGPRASILIVTKKGEGEPDPYDLLGTLRIDHLQRDLDTPAGVTYSADNNGDSDYVRVSFDGKDTDPPVLDVHSDPPKGTKVAAGQQITVTIRASELLHDGHKSWPSGIQVIQLKADDGLVNSQDYGKPPAPCAVRTETWRYTVPANPPPIVHLLAKTEKRAGLEANKSADFPTAPWYGTIKAHGQGYEFNNTLDLHILLSRSAPAASSKGMATPR